MMRHFIHQTKNKFGDTLEAEMRDGVLVILTMSDKDGDLQRAILNRSDLDAIIEKLTALRDGVVS